MSSCRCCMDLAMSYVLCPILSYIHMVCTEIGRHRAQVREIGAIRFNDDNDGTHLRRIEEDLDETALRILLKF